MKSIFLISLKVLLLIIIIPFTTYSQENTDTSSTEIEDFSFLMLNASYTNNNLESVPGTIEKIPIIFTNASFIHKTGLYIGGSYANYFNSNTQTFEYDIEAGYQKYFDSGFDFDLYYNKHEYSGDTLLEGINYDHSLNASIGQDIGKLYLSVDFSYLLMSKVNNSFLDINLSRSIQFDKLFFNNDVLLINPSISLAFGTDYWLYNDLTYAQRIAIATDLRSNGYSFRAFTYESFDIFIPVSYGIGSTYLSFSWIYRIPGEKYKFLGWENQSGFMISLTYFLNFSK